MSKKFFITTPIYYVNSVPHIGHAYTTIALDILARYKRQQGADVHFLTGTDEHGANIEKSATAKGVSPQEWTDQISAQYRQMWKELNISYDDFIRTTDSHHEHVVQAIFEKLLKVNPISIDDDFFNLGGDSLLVINLQIELNKLGYNITYADLFVNSTIQEIEKKIMSHTQKE